MDESSNIIFILFFILSFSNFGSTIKCYVCSSHAHGVACEDPFEGEMEPRTELLQNCDKVKPMFNFLQAVGYQISFKEGYLNACQKMIITNESGSSIVIRGCATEGACERISEENSTENLEYCQTCSSEDMCNNSNSKIADFWILLATTIIITVLNSI